jgi:ornithine cyclodeaminase/alanine dehydrogenase-like protein (mu-crystallin family)
MRVAADGGIGVKYMARKDATVVGMLGSGGMARSHMQAFMAVRRIKKLQVYSPTRENREAFGREMAAKYDIEVKPCDRPDDIYKGAHIVAALTDSAVPVLDGTLLEPGTHIVNVGGSGRLDAESLRRIDVYLRFGDAPAPVGRPEFAIDDQFLRWEARPGSHKRGGGSWERAHGVALPDKRVTLGDIASGKAAGRTSDEQITWSERGNLQGAQFYAIAGRIYELAKAAKLGYEIPTSLFLQDIRD